MVAIIEGLPLQHQTATCSSFHYSFSENLVDFGGVFIRASDNMGRRGMVKVEFHAGSASF